MYPYTIRVTFTFARVSLMNSWCGTSSRKRENRWRQSGNTVLATEGAYVGEI